jgi:PAS domain S-box-containing protein
MKYKNFSLNFNNILILNLLSFGEFLYTALFLFGLYLTSLISYDIFHILIEIFCVIIAFGIFIIAWNARSFFDNHFLLFLSIAYLFISFIDIAHTLTSQGIGIFSFIDPTVNLTTQLWLAARYVQAFSLVLAPLFLTRKINTRLISEIYFLVIILIFIFIFYLNIFPNAYINGTGLTLFEKISEYLISAIFVYSAYLLYKKRKALNKKIFYLIFISIIFSIASELSFTTYLGMFGFSNMLGHYFKLISFLLIYKTIVETGFKNPLSNIFKNLEQNAVVLKASELKFRTLVELSTNAIILTNSKGEIELWNSSAERIFGWEKNKVLGKSLDFLIPKKQKGFNELNHGISINEDGPNNSNKALEIDGKRKNGEIFPLEISFSSWKTDNEQFVCYIMRDISVRKKTESDLLTKSKKLENLVNDLKVVQLSMDNAFTHIIITDENGFIIYANKAAEETTGYNKKEMVNEKPSLWGKQMPPSFYENLWKTVKIEKKKFAGEIINKRKNGSLYNSEIRIAPVLDENNEAKFFVAIERDITEQKEMDRAKSEFISLAAHQLRTPISTISITTEMLLGKIVGDISKENKKYLKQIFMEVRNMTEMIDVFLNVSRIEMNKFPIKIEPLSLYAIIDKTVKAETPQIEDKNIHFKKEYKKSLPILDLDKNVMMIILENLLSNAIKYSHKGGKISLSAEEKGNNVVIEIKDNGIGIPEKEQYRIFTKMFRAENTSSIKSEGSGLGLYLVKNLAEQSNYNISFKSKENEGTTFTLSIPKKISK